MFDWFFSWIFYFLCFCNSSPDLPFESAWALTNIASTTWNTRPDQSCCECCSCGWTYFFVGLPHQVGDTLVNLNYFLMWMWKFLIFFFLLSLLGNFNAWPILGTWVNRILLPHCSPAASSRIPAMPNAEEEKIKRCRQKSLSACFRFPNPIFPLPLYLWIPIPSQVPSYVSPFP